MSGVDAFEVGEMVWAKMYNETWWPGHVYNESLATPLVRQSKREGLSLVALFGDSSFAWFRRADLVPFDLNYGEKCKQSDGKKFVKAVEDAVKEVSRRVGVGLSCGCRKKGSLRKGGGVGGGKVGESFQPRMTVEFVRKLALEPTGCECVDIGFVKNKATVVSYRNAVFGTVQVSAPQETAFKVDHVIKDTANVNDDVKKDESKQIKKEKEEVASSPMLVLSKDATRSLEVKPPPVYESNNPCFEINTSVVESPTSSSFAEVDQAKVRFATAKKADQPEVLQRSDCNYKTELSLVLGDLLSLAVDPSTVVNRGSRIKVRKSILRFRSHTFQKGQNFSLPLVSDEVATVKPEGWLKRGPSVRQEERAVAKRKKFLDIRTLTKEKKVIKIDEPASRDVKQPVAATFIKAGSDVIRKTEHRAPEPTMLMMKFPQGGYLPSVSELKERFASFGPMDHSATQIFQKTFSCQVVFRHKVHAEAARRFVVGSSGLFGNTDVKCSLEGAGDVGSAEPRPPVKVLEEAHQQPSHRPQSVVPATSLVFQNGQNFSPSLVASDPNAIILSEDSVEVRPVKPQGGLKRGPIDLQEEIAAAKRKKLGGFRDLIKEKKVTKKIDEPPARNVKQPVAAILKKPGPQLVNKTEKRAPGPTMLTIKFKQGGPLPSFTELKTRFACYGPLDHSGTHIFWNTFSCQVLFRHKAHAEAAYKFVVGSSSLFGNKVVKCNLKEVGIAGLAKPEPPVKDLKEDRQQPEMDDRSTSMIPTTSDVELKSILKKFGVEEAAGNGGRGRVKFVLGGEESQMKNSMENETSHLTMDISSEIFQKAGDPTVITGPPAAAPMHHSTTLVAPSSLPLPQRYMEMTPLKRPVNAQFRAPYPDIAQQMLSLLTRCNDVVTNINCILGYTPYHPL